HRRERGQGRRRGRRAQQGPAKRSHAPAAEQIAPARLLPFLEIVDRIVDELVADAPDLLCITREQAVIAHRVDEARHSAGVLRDPADRAWREEFEIGCAGHTQPGPDVVAHLPGLEWRNLATQSDALLELPELRQIQSGSEFGLADEDNLE